VLDLDAYRLPISPSLEALFGPFGLGQPELRGPGTGEQAGIDLAAERGAEVRVVRLLNQSADAELLEVGKLRGLTVVTLHATGDDREPGSYLLIHGELGKIPPGLERGTKLREGALIGWVGNPDGPGLCHVHFEVRKVRDGVDAHREPMDKLMQDAMSFSTDPRNVLPLRSPAGSAGSRDAQP
jgi:murein DD-endopeptidase MepM/ murein hydrolase activator NlpD